MKPPFVGGPCKRARPAPPHRPWLRVPPLGRALTLAFRVRRRHHQPLPLRRAIRHADLPDPSDPLFEAITYREFETLTTLFHAAYRRARARMPWCGWLTFIDPTALVVDPPGAPHIFPGKGDWCPQPESFLDSLRHSDAAPDESEIAHLRFHFEHIFRTGSRTDLPPCAARLRRILRSPASTAVLARAGVVPPSRTLCLTETGTTTGSIADLLKFAARLLFLVRTDPLVIPLDCSTSLNRQYGSDDTDRRLGLLFPACPAR